MPRSKIGLDYKISEGKLKALTARAPFPTPTGSPGAIRLRSVFDGQDDPAVPSEGTRIVADISRTLQSPNLAAPIDQIDLRTSTFFPIGFLNRTDPGARRKTSLFVIGSGGITFHAAAGCANLSGSLGGPLQLFTLGGPFHLGAYLPGEFIGTDYALAAIGFRREFFSVPPPLKSSVYWGAWYDAGTAFFNAGPVV